MISSELPEILGMCDRILVMCEGEVVGEFNRADTDKETIMGLATGSTAGRPIWARCSSSTPLRRWSLAARV